MNDHNGAALMIAALPPAKELLGGGGFDSNAFRTALEMLGIQPGIPRRKNRKVQQPYHEAPYRQHPPPRIVLICGLPDLALQRGGAGATSEPPRSGDGRY